jgi:hemoglobin
MADTLYKRLGGYDAIAAVADNLLSRLTADPQLGRFWKHRGDDGVRREKQLLIDYLCTSAGGPLYYVGRDMKVAHRGMGINERDWQILLGHMNSTLDHFKVPTQEKSEVLGFVESLKKDVVE